MFSLIRGGLTFVWGDLSWLYLPSEVWNSFPWVISLPTCACLGQRSFGSNERSQTNNTGIQGAARPGWMISFSSWSLSYLPPLFPSPLVLRRSKNLVFSPSEHAERRAWVWIRPGWGSVFLHWGSGFGVNEVWCPRISFPLLLSLTNKICLLRSVCLVCANLISLPLCWVPIAK